MRRTKEQAAETRRAILKAAEALFLADGYENVSLDQIAAAAGVTRGAVHWHFQNKQGLLFGIRDLMGRPMQDLAARLAADTTLKPLVALAVMVSGMFARLQADPRQRQVLRVLLALDAAAPAEEAASGIGFQQQLRASLTGIFAAARRAGDLPAPWTPRSAAIAFNAMLNGLVNEWARGHTDFELVPDADAVVRTVLDAWSARAGDAAGRAAGG